MLQTIRRGVIFVGQTVPGEKRKSYTGDRLLFELTIYYLIIYGSHSRLPSLDLRPQLERIEVGSFVESIHLFDPLQPPNNYICYRRC